MMSSHRTQSNASLVRYNTTFLAALLLSTGGLFAYYWVAQQSQNVGGLGGERLKRLSRILKGFLFGFALVFIATLILRSTESKTGLIIGFGALVLLAFTVLFVLVIMLFLILREIELLRGVELKHEVTLLIGIVFAFLSVVKLQGEINTFLDFPAKQ
ncbi:hypothetical protein [Aliiroseovarius crassostreae]|uniref:hypothetical protein n=1 Tax=Aliiroseovarius crassostreae TaxID=154981 RepID=UPI002200C893|nr:hypothetical protein [Aliiroseovarius crassostreae]UWQ08835.1 hypothetical protein K3X25_04435 [Aliiroseovarius crassostreae]